MRTATWYIFIALLLAACGGRNDEALLGEAPPADSLPRFDHPLSYFDAAARAYPGDSIRRTADYILAGIDAIAFDSLPAGPSRDTLMKSLQELERMAARLSRHELEAHEQDVERAYARAYLEMAHVQLLLSELSQKNPPGLRDFVRRAIAAAQPFLSGQALEAAEQFAGAAQEAYLSSARDFIATYKSDVEL
jgi:hypothetical protein